MVRTRSAFAVFAMGVVVSACLADIPPLASDASTSSDSSSASTTGSGGAGGQPGFCASRAGYIVCEDFDATDVLPANWASVRTVPGRCHVELGDVWVTSDPRALHAHVDGEGGGGGCLYSYLSYPVDPDPRDVRVEFDVRSEVSGSVATLTWAGDGFDCYVVIYNRVNEIEISAQRVPPDGGGPQAMSMTFPPVGGSLTELRNVRVEMTRTGGAGFKVNGEDPMTSDDLSPWDSCLADAVGAWELRFGAHCVDTPSDPVTDNWYDNVVLEQLD